MDVEQNTIDEEIDEEEETVENIKDEEPEDEVF